MSKFTTLPSLAIAVVGFTTISRGSAFAAPLNPASLTPLTLTHDDMAPNRVAGYVEVGVDQELALGTRCGLSADYAVANHDPLRSHPLHAQTHQSYRNLSNQ